MIMQDTPLSNPGPTNKELEEVMARRHFVVIRVYAMVWCTWTLSQIKEGYH